MLLAQKMDEFGRGGWIVATILAFFLFWPIGLALLAFMLGSGRLRPWYGHGPGRWYSTAENGDRRGQRHGGGWGGGGCGWGWGGRRDQRPASGNQAFDDYRAETLRRLEAEQQEFVEYLERLRQARDKAEFDQFMEERRPRPPMPEHG